MHKERLFSWRKSAEKLFCCDIRALLDCDILTGFGGLKNEVVRHIVEEFLYAKKIENQTERTLRGYKNAKNGKNYSTDCITDSMTEAVFYSYFCVVYGRF